MTKNYLFPFGKQSVPFVHFPENDSSPKAFRLFEIVE